MRFLPFLIAALGTHAAVRKPILPTPPVAAQQTRPAPLLLESKGAIPEDFRGDPTDKVPTLEGRNGKELGFWASRSNSSEKRDWKEFWWRQLSHRRDLALRGWALHGDPATTYLEEVLDSVLVSEPELRKRLRIYACPSPYVNAIMLPDGVVLVTFGMLARLADESQLALVLAHEASHFSLRHAEDSWWETRDARSSGSDRWEKTRFQHSRERESEADSLALKYLLSSRYSAASVDSIFGMLDASDNAAGERPWTPAALAGFPDLGIPDSCWLEPSKVISAPPETEDSDSLGTHPAIPRRRAASKRILGTSPRPGETWLVGKERFLAVREAARRAVPRGWLEADQPAAALFEAWSLLEGSPSDRALRETFDQALVDLALDRGATRRTAARTRRVRIWGSYQTLDHFLKSLDDARLFALALLAAGNQPPQARDSLFALLVPELLEEFQKALPLHLAYLRDTSRIARSLRAQRPALDRIRQVLPRLARDSGFERTAPADSGARPLGGGVAVLAGVDWGEKPLLKPFGGAEGARRALRASFASALASTGLRVVAPDPVDWGPDSLAAQRRLSQVRDWAMERLDARGPTRFRPRLPALRRNLSAWGADRVILLSVDYAPQERDFDRTLHAQRVAWLGDPRRAWSLPQPYLMAAVFDARDGSVVSVARQRLWESMEPEFLENACKRLVKDLDPAR